MFHFDLPSQYEEILSGRKMQFKIKIISISESVVFLKFRLVVNGMLILLSIEENRFFSKVDITD